jgi:hypothetical protein
MKPDDIIHSVKAAYSHKTRTFYDWQVEFAGFQGVHDDVLYRVRIDGQLVGSLLDHYGQVSSKGRHPRNPHPSGHWTFNTWLLQGDKWNEVYDIPRHYDPVVAAELMIGHLKS